MTDNARILTDDELGFDKGRGSSTPTAKPKTLSDADIGFEPPARGLKGWTRDIGGTALNAAISVPETAVGVADIVTNLGATALGFKPPQLGKRVEDAGLRFKEAKEFVNENIKSDASREAHRKFQEAEGIGGKFHAAIENPSLIAEGVAESLGSIGAGGVAARGLMAVTRLGQMGAKGAAIAGGLGEGATMAGAQASAIRQETEDGLLTPTQAGLALGTGALGTAFGIGGARAAHALGVGNIDTMLAQGTKGMAKEFADDATTAAAQGVLQQKALKGIPRQVIEGAIAEGLLEELPQSVAEQVLQNIALGKPWHEEVDSAIVMGTLTGGAMGAGAAGYSGFARNAATKGNPGADVTGSEAGPDGQPNAPANPGVERLRSAFADQLAAERAAGANTPVLDEDVMLANGIAPQARIDPAQMGKWLDTPAQPIKPSEAMGLDPTKGTLSAAAALAVDSGASQTLQAATQQTGQASAIEQSADAETGEIGAIERASQIQERLGFLAQMGSSQGWDPRMVQDRDALQAELSALMPELTTSAPKQEAPRQVDMLDTADVGGRIQQLQAQAAAADAEARDWATREYKRNAKPLPAHEAAGGAGDVGEANEQRRLKAISDAQGRAAAARAEITQLQEQANADAALAGKSSPAFKTGATTDGTQTPQAQQAKPKQRAARPASGKAVNGVPAAAQAADPAADKGLTHGGPTSEDNGGQAGAKAKTKGAATATAIAQAGNASRAAESARKLEASERWTRMTTVERQAVTANAPGLNAMQRKNLHTRPWADMTDKTRAALMDAIAPVEAVATQKGSKPEGDEKPFAPDTGTLGIPRAEMPQVPTQSHGGLVKHLNAQGIAHETTTVDAAALKPTQAEYSPSKVAKAKEATGDRAVIVSNDGHIIDGHHQAIAAAEDGKAVKAIVLDAPVEQALEAVKNSPSASVDTAKSAVPVAEGAKPVGRIEDVGEKIGGARKDVWTGFKDDLRAVADDQIQVQPLSKVWPQPDYQKLIDAGASVETMAMVRALRDAVETKPRVSYKVKRWADQVAALRGFASDILDGKASVDAIKVQMRSVQSRDVRNVLGRADLYEAVGHSKSLEGISFEERHYSLYNGRKDVNLWVIDRAAKATAFSNWPRELASADTKEQAIEAFKKTYGQLDQAKEKKSASFDIFSETFMRGYFVGKKLGRTYAKLAGPFPSIKEARAHRDANETDLTKQLQAYKEVPQERGDENRPRVGQDMRNGVDVTPQQFRETFGFRGVEFGNWVEQGKRQQELNQAYDALMDMAAVLQLPAKAISLNGELGLAFGARGGGGTGAAKAHYESGKVVINMTKRAGAGSLGHEWWHALDNYFSRQRKAANGFMTSATDVHASAGGKKSALGVEGVRPEMIDAFGAVVRSINLTALRERSKALDERRSKDYWSTGIEMSARSFESYLIAKLQDQNASNDYLANVVSPKAWETAAKDGVKLDGTYPYPSIDELPKIREGFDKFFLTVETKDTDQGVAMFRRSEANNADDFDVQGFLRTMNQGQPEFSEAARAQAVDQVKGTADAIRKAWANGPEVVVAFDMADPIIPEAVRQADLQQRSGGALGAPEGFYYEGKAYLMASQLKTPNDTARVLSHEVLGHHGLRAVFGPELNKILNQVATMRKAEVDAKIKEYGLRGVTLQDRRIAAEEVLAEMAQTNPQIGFVKRAVAAIRTWLRKNVPGFQSMKLTDTEIINNYLLPARAWVERGGQDQGAQHAGVNLSPAASRSAMKSVDANIARGRKAMQMVLVEKADQHRAMYRNGLGWVDFTWGDSKRGIEHIIKRRMESDGMSLADVQRMLTDKVVETIASGEEVRRAESGLATRLVLDHKGNEAVLVKRKGANGWLLTAYEKVPDASAGGATRSSATQSIATRSRNGLGAGTESILNKNNDVGNIMFSRSKLADLKDKGMTLAHNALSHPGKVSWWDKTVGTMRHLAERNPAFKPVFEAAQRFIEDVSTLTNEAASVAPRLLPRVETWSDLKFWGKDAKTSISAGDNKAIAKALFEGTKDWARDLNGNAVLVSDLKDKYRNLAPEQKVEVMLAGNRMAPREVAALRALPMEQFETLANERFESRVLKAGVVWNAKELKDVFNLTDHQISLYQEARAGFDKSLDITSRADMLRNLGRDWDDLRDIVMDAPTLTDAWKLLDDELEQRAKDIPDSRDRMAEKMFQIRSIVDKAQELMASGYAPLSRFGSYTVHVEGKDKESLYFGMFDSMLDANRMAQDMRDAFKHDKDAKVTQGTKGQEKFKLFQGMTPESMEMFGSMLGLNEEGDQAGDKAYQAYLQLAKNNHSALKRLIHRKGTAGYNEDVGRVLASFVYSNARLAAGGLNAGTMEAAIQAIPKEQGELEDVAMQLRSYIQDPQEEGLFIRSMLFAQYLGGSLASAFVNTTQPFAVTLPWLTQYGGMQLAAKHMTRALKDMATKGFQYEADLARAVKLAEDDGTLSPQEVHQIMAQARGTGSLRAGDGTVMGKATAAAANGWIRTKVAWGQPFALAEQFNRRSTFITSYRMAKERGMDNPAEFARKAVLETQFLYSKANKMRWGRGAVGGTLMTFKTYTVSYLELMHRMWNAGEPGSPERAEGRRAVMWAMAMLLLMSGAGGLPFMEDIEDLVDGAGQKMGYNFSLKRERQAFLRGVFGSEMADFMEQGISGLPGMPTDVSGRLGVGNIIPGTGLALDKPNRERDLLELAGPGGDFVKRGFSALGMALTGKVVDAALEVSPTAVRNAQKGADMLSSGMAKDAKGYKTVETNALDGALKLFGFQPTVVAEDSEAVSHVRRATSFYSLTSADIKAQWADALFRKDDAALDDARKRVEAWNRNNPDMPIVIKIPDMWKRAREMAKPREERVLNNTPKAIRQQMREFAARE